MNHFQRIKGPIFIFCYESIAMLCFIIRSHVRPYQESKIIQAVDWKMSLSAILLSPYLNLTLAAVCHAYRGSEMTFIKMQLVLSVCFQNLVLAKRDISFCISTTQFHRVLYALFEYSVSGFQLENSYGRGFLVQMLVKIPQQKSMKKTCRNPI